jgi:hypothetical protein
MVGDALRSASSWCPYRPRYECLTARPNLHMLHDDQIQFLLGDVSIQTTERYLGCKQKLRCALNDRLGIEPDAA